MLSILILQAQPGLLMQWGPIVFMLAVVYFLMIRPQQTKAKAQKSFQESLQKGDLVATGSGIVGKITKMNGRTVQLETAGKTHIEGTNDLSFGLPDNLILSNIKTMTRQARHFNILFILGIPSTYYPSGEAKLYEINLDQFIARLEGYQEKVRQFIEIDQCPYIDFSYGMDKEHFLDDGIHPNEAGQIIMADRAAQVIQNF